MRFPRISSRRDVDSDYRRHDDARLTREGRLEHSRHVLDRSQSGQAYCAARLIGWRARRRELNTLMREFTQSLQQLAVALERAV